MAARRMECQGGLPQRIGGPSQASMIKDEDDRKKRLAEALRQNLKRRKAQARGAAATEPQPDGGER